MIIRKPYAFLIKYFKLIHLFMLLLTSYILYKSYNIYQFFNDYVNTRQVISSNTLASDTIPFLIFIVSLIIILLFASIFILFKQKDKPKLLYILGMLYYGIFIIISIVSRSTILTISLEGIDPRISRIIRDIWLVAFIIQIGFVIVLLIRSSGFDIKRFDFKEDIEGLQISDEDNEEIELSSRFDADKVKMKAAMQKEEWKSFFYENKLIILIILFITLVVLPGTFIAKSVVENKRYKENEVIKLDKINFKITNSYITKKDYKNNILLKDKNSYLIVKFNIESKDKSSLILDNLRLEIGNNVYIPVTTSYNHFIDIGVGYEKQTIENTSKDYIAVYLLSEEELKKELIIRYADKIQYKNNNAIANYKRTIINPINLDTTINEKQIVLNQEYVFKDNSLKDTSINITSFSVKDKFETPNSKNLIVNNIGYVLKLDYKYTKSFADIVNKYGSLTYILNDKEYKEQINIITPKNYPEGEIFLAVDEDVGTSPLIKFKLVIRNNIYTWILE